MNITYVASIRLPTEKAHGYQIMRVCHELAKLGHTITLYVPKRKNHIIEDPFIYYNIEKNFSLKIIPSVDFIMFAHLLGPFASWLSEQLFIRSFSIPKGTIICTRDHRTADFFARRDYKTFYNAHNWKSSRKKFLKKVSGVVCNSEGTEKAIKESMDVLTLVAHNATDPNPFVSKEKITLRKELNLPPTPVVLYAGHLYEWKGITTILETARNTPEICFVCIGGTKEDVERVARIAPPNMLLLGHKPKEIVPKYLASADILLLPNSGRSEESVRYTSPMKLFEYLASGTPVIASDLPSFRSIISEDEVFFVRPDDFTALADVVRVALADLSISKKRSTNALALSRSFTWSAHAKKIANFLCAV